MKVIKSLLYVSFLIGLFAIPASAQLTGTITDIRDGKNYDIVKIGDRWWMAENLNYGIRISGSLNQTNNGIKEKYCYSNLSAYCDTFGAFYQWNEVMNYSSVSGAQGLCPAGWHIPSDGEWKELETFLGMSEVDANLEDAWRGTNQGDQLKSAGGSGFNALLEGFRTTSGGFSYKGSGSFFWTSDNYSRYLYNSQNGIYRDVDPDINYGFAVRCIQDYPFIELDAGLPQLRNSITKWGDYDNDGDMDLFLCGITTYPNGVSDIYRNNGNGTFTPLGLSIERISGSADWGDFDCDGDLDLLITGYYSASYITRLYRNNGGGSFSNYTITVPGGKIVKWGDYDSDGDLDILINLEDNSINIFENKGTGDYQRTDIYFEQIETDFLPLSQASFDWGDFNNDGFPDIVIIGNDNIDNKYCKVYKNNGNKSFTELDLMLRGVSSGSVSWGDFDNDGDLDILQTGYYNDLQVYRNEGNDIFSFYNTGLIDDQTNSSWMDYNNDGNLDIVLLGPNSSLYEGDDEGDFNQIPCSITNCNIDVEMDIADYDNDNNLDFIYSGFVSSDSYTRIYRNNTTVVNSVPQVPVGLTAKQVGPDVVFSWNPANDAENGTNLSYNIRVGTSSGNCLIVTPMSNLANGKRLKLNSGNVGYDTTWILKNAPLGTLYWSVQSIDKTLRSSAFAGVKNIQVKPPFSDISIHSDLEVTDLNISGNSFIDFNNDGLLDILTSATQNTPGIPLEEVFCFINQGSNIFTKGNITGSELAGKFIPFNLNNDGYIDALLYGYDYIPTGVLHFYETVLKVYTLTNNQSNGFTVSTSDFADIRTRAITTGDFDNDGDDDIVMYGYKSDTLGLYLYKRENSGYIATDLGFQFDSDDQAISSVDIDNDLDLDLIYGKHILLNDSVFIEIGSFLFKDVISMDWGDFDGDQDMDVAIYGIDTIDNYNTTIYENQGNLYFIPLKNKIQAFNITATIRWLDFNNDGLLDLSASGKSNSGSSTYIYLNQGNGSFLEIVYSGKVFRDWGDFDNDGDLDMLTSDSISVSNGNWGNNPPNYPENLKFELDSFDVILSWNNALDDKNSNGLTYNVRIGNTKDNFDIMDVLTSEDGQLRVPRMGNVQTNNSWRLKNFTTGQYYWSVQAIDQSYSGGSWAPTDSFMVTKVSPDFAFETELCLGNNIEFTDLSVTTDSVINWKWQFGDGTVSDLQNPTHQYQTADTFDVTLWAYSQYGDSASRTHKVIVKPSPVAGFTSSTVCSGIKTSFTNTSLTNGLEISSWHWDFGDDETSAAEGTIQHLYAYEGTYNVQLTVAAANGCVATYSDSVTFKPILPKPEIYTMGPNVWILACSNDTAKEYKWYYNGTLLPEARKPLYVANKQTGYYHIRISDGNGCYTSSDTILIGDENKGAVNGMEDKIIVYPNPNDGTFELYLQSNSTGECEVSVYNILGKLMYSDNIVKTDYLLTDKIELNSSDAGIYSIHLKIGNKVIIRQLIVN